MRTFLSHDEASGNLRLVMTDTYDGQHERTEFRVLNSDGSPMRRGQELDGQAAYRDSFGGYYVKSGAFGEGRRSFTIEHTAVGPTVKTPCPKAENRRRKCALCA